MRSFEDMNSIWDKWVPAGAAPARATVEAKLASPVYAVEIGLIAAR
jgi:enamine deaminase RidA (YjgF/YER057c/UK114 family)